MDTIKIKTASGIVEITRLGPTCLAGLWFDCTGVPVTTVSVRMLKGPPLDLPTCADCARDAQPQVKAPKTRRPTVVRFRSNRPRH